MRQSFGVGLGLAAGVLAVLPAGASGTAATEHPVRVLPLAGPVSLPDAEISSLAWLGDELLILPQYPERKGDQVFLLSRTELERASRGEGGAPLRPRPLAFRAPHVAEAILGYEGFEAIAVDGDRVYVTVEAQPPAGPPKGWLLSGRVTQDGGSGARSIVIDAESRRPLEAQTGLSNLAYEAITLVENEVLVFYETSGRQNPRPRVKRFGRDLSPRADLPFERLEYRLTDTTAPDRRGRFWGMNYFWPGADWKPGPCALRARFGVGPTHARSQVVERIVEFRRRGRFVRPTGRPPLQLELEDRGEGEGRNWEGLVRLGDRGFLVATDRHPRTMLAFVPNM